MPDNFLHGVSVVEVESGARAVKGVSSSVIGIIGTAEGAVAEAFPVNTPVLLGNSATDIAKLGTTGTLPTAIAGILAQTGANIVVVRIACVLEHIFWALGDESDPPKEISQDTVIKAIVLIEDYFKPMAEKVLSECLRDNSCDVAQSFIRYLTDNKISQFNIRELKRKHVLNFEDKQQAEDDFLSTLTDANVIEQIVTNKTGRPSKDYAVNPKLAEIKL